MNHMMRKPVLGIIKQGRLEQTRSATKFSWSLEEFIVIRVHNKSTDVQRTSDTVNGSHNVSLPMILIKIKVGQLL